MDMVAAEHNIDGCMEFDTGNLCAAQLLHIIDMMNVVVLNEAEHASHTSYNTCLFAWWIWQRLTIWLPTFSFSQP